MKWFLMVLLFVHINYGESVDCSKEHKNTEVRLKKDLLCDYDKSIRPSNDHNERTRIGIHMLLKNFEVSEEVGAITINNWMMMRWTDQHLKWDPKSYDNINYILEDSSEIWIPDLFNFYGSLTKTHEACDVIQCKIRFNGEVRCNLPCSYQAACDLNLAYWPYDRKNCTLVMGYWESTGKDINYKMEKSSLIHNFMSKHNQWKLLYTDFQLDEQAFNSTFSNQSYEFPAIQFYFVIQRHSSFEAALILCPIFVFVVFNLITLWLEPGCFIRIALLITNLILHFILNQTLTWYAPNSAEDSPKIVTFFRDSIILTGVLLLETVITRSIVRFQAVSVPNWIKNGSNYLADSAVGRYFNAEHINEYGGILDDGEALVDSKQTNTKDNIVWTLFAKLIDRILFVIYIIVYTIMYVSLIPKGYETVPDLDSKSISKIPM